MLETSEGMQQQRNQDDARMTHEPGRASPVGVYTCMGGILECCKKRNWCIDAHVAVDFKVALGVLMNMLHAGCGPAKRMGAALAWQWCSREQVKACWLSSKARLMFDYAGT